LPFRGRVAVAFPHPVHHHQREAGWGIWEADVMTREQSCRAACEPHRPPAIGDDPWCDADAHDARRPAECGDGEGKPRGSTAGAEWEDDRVRRGGELRGELQSREQMAHHGAGMRSPAGYPATRAERPRATPCVKHRERERGLAPACTTSAARARQAEATARLAGVSGCGNCASTARPPAAAACTAVARQWVEPVPPSVTKTVPVGAPAKSNSSPRTLFPP